MALTDAPSPPQAVPSAIMMGKSWVYSFTKANPPKTPAKRAMEPKSTGFLPHLSASLPERGEVIAPARAPQV